MLKKEGSSSKRGMFWSPPNGSSDNTCKVDTMPDRDQGLNCVCGQLFSPKSVRASDSRLEDPSLSLIVYFYLLQTTKTTLIRLGEV